MNEKLQIIYKGDNYEYTVMRSGIGDERTDFLLQPANANNGSEKKLINANEIWFTWRKENKQFFTTNIKVALDAELFECFSNAIMKHYLNAHNTSKQRFK